MQDFRFLGSAMRKRVLVSQISGKNRRAKDKRALQANLCFFGGRRQIENTNHLRNRKSFHQRMTAYFFQQVPGNSSKLTIGIDDQRAGSRQAVSKRRQQHLVEFGAER